MIVSVTSILTGKDNTMDLPVTPHQVTAWLNGMKIQDAMPHLTATQREFLLTGMSEDEQARFFGKDDEG